MRFEITQTEEWKSFQLAAGRSTYMHNLESGEESLFIKFKLPLNRSWALGLGVDFEKFTEQDWHNLMKWARENNCTHIRCEGYSTNQIWSDAKKPQKILNTYQLQDVEKSYLPKWTIKVNLQNSEEDILAQMKRKGRYNIKVAKKAGVVVESYMGDKVSGKVLDEFYSVLSETGGRDKFGIHSKSYYEKMLSSLGGKVRLYVARLDKEGRSQNEGKIIAGTIVVYDDNSSGGEAVYYYGASSNDHRNVMAPYLLQWTAMQDAKKAGKAWYDFMGVARVQAELIPRGDFQEVTGESIDGFDAKKVTFDPKDPLYGVTEFKQKFGGQIFEFEKPVDVIVSPFWYRVIKFVKKLRG